MSKRQFPTLTGFLTSKSSNPTINDTVEFQGYDAIGVGASEWQHNGITGQTPSQSPAQLGDALLNDGNGNQWELVGTAQFNASALGVIDTGLDVTPEFNAVLSHANLMSGRYRRTKVNLPTGKLKVTNLVIDNAGSETGKTNGRIIIQGQGEINTDIVSSSPTGDVIKLISGKVQLKDFSVNSDGITRSKTIGSGHGVSVDSTDGVNPDTVTVANFSLSHIQVDSQPENGFNFLNPELVTTSNCMSSGNGNDGYLYDGSNFGGDVKGISNYSVNCRALGNGNAGLRELLLSESTFANFQALENDGVDQIYSSGRGVQFISPDVEGKTCVSNDTGVRLFGAGSMVLGGLFFGLVNGIRLVGQGQTVNRPHFSNFGLGFAMLNAVNADFATNYNISLSKDDYSPQNITNEVTPHLAANGGSVSRGEYYSFPTMIGKKNSFTVTSNTPFSFGDNGIAGNGSISSQLYFLTLESNAVIQTPVNYKDGQEFEIIFFQDAIGSRVVTFSGSPWVDNITMTGNSAGAYSSVRFKAVSTPFNGIKFIQICAQMPWTS